MNRSTTNINLALVLTEAITDVSPILFDGETAGNESDTDFRAVQGNMLNGCRQRICR